MINFKLIFKILGTLLLVEAVLFGICLAQSFYFGESDRLTFALSIGVSLGLAALLRCAGRDALPHMNRRDSYLCIGLSWLVFSLVGMVPFLLSGLITNPVDAWFESVAGFTTTGASVVDNLDAWPHGLRFWRCFSQWLGGLGIVLFTMALLPLVATGETRLFAAEQTGPRKLRLHPHIKTTVMWLWTIYLALTLACAASLWLCGMNLFDSLGHALTTTATGGFSTRQDGIMSYHSPAIEWTLIAFMFVSGINFSLLYLAIFRRKVRAFARDTELRAYAGIALVASCAVAYLLVVSAHMPVGEAVRKALFQVVSMQTTTGFACDDFMTWPVPTWLPLTLVMLIGASAGSTSGGIKTVRVVMLFRLTMNEFRHILHPRAVLPVRVNHRPISNDIIRTLTAFVFVFIVLTVAGSLFLSLLGVNYIDSLSLSLSSLSNVGPCVGYGPGGVGTWSQLPDAGKLMCAFFMIIGRLEIFSFLLLFTPGFWRES